MKKLTKQEKKFAKLYIQNRNHVDTKLQLGYDVDLSKKHIREYIQSKAIKTAFEVPKDPILRIQYAIATFDHLSMHDKDGDVKPLKSLTDEQRMALRSYRETKDGAVFTTHNKQQALDALMKHLGLFEKDNAQKKDTTAVQLNFNDMYNDKTES